MQIRYVTLSAGPEGIFQPGSEQDVPESRARALIAAGSAVAVDSPQTRSQPVQQAVKVPEEKAVTHEPHASNRAPGRSGKPRRGKGASSRKP